MSCKRITIIRNLIKGIDEPSHRKQLKTDDDDDNNNDNETLVVYEN